MNGIEDQARGGLARAVRRWRSLTVAVAVLIGMPAWAFIPGPLQAVPDSVVTDEATPVTFDPLDNDIGPVVRRSVKIAVPPARGEASVSQTPGRLGLITYSPAPGWNGTDQFSYEVCGVTRTNCRLATVSVQILPMGRFRPVFSRLRAGSLGADFTRTWPDGGSAEILGYGGTDGMAKFSPDGANLATAFGGSLTVKRLRSPLPLPDVSAEAEGRIAGFDWSPSGDSLVVWVLAAYPAATLYTMEMPTGPLEVPELKPLVYQSGESTLPVIGSNPSWGVGGIYFDTWNNLDAGVMQLGIALFGVGGTSAPRIVIDERSAKYPAASKRSGKLAYVIQERQGAPYILKVKPGPAPALPLFSSTAAIMGPAWSPDESKLIFQLGSGTGESIWVVNGDLANPQARRIAGGETDYVGYRYASWDPVPAVPPPSPTTVPGRIYFNSGRYGESYPGGPSRALLTTIRPDGSGRSTHLSAGAFVTDGYGQNGTRPTPDPTGARVVFAAMPTGIPTATWNLFTAGVLDGAAPRQLTDGRATATGSDEAFDPTWSPDGSQIAYVRNLPVAGRALWIMKGDGSEPHALTAPPPHHADGNPAFRPDGSRVAFLRWLSAKATLWTVRTDGSELRIVNGVGEVNGFGFSPDGSKIAFTQMTTSPPGSELTVGEWDDSKGFPEVRNPKTLVRLPGVTVYTPSWSPDGRAIVYCRHTVRDGYLLAAVNADGTRDTQISFRISTTDTAKDTMPKWGRPGPILAEGDAYETNVDTPLSVPAPGVLENDYSPDPAQSPADWMAILVAGPPNGEVSLSFDGGFRYTPRRGFVGSDTFSYLALDADRVRSQVVTVAVEVVGQPSPPPELRGVRVSQQGIQLSWSVSAGEWTVQFAPAIAGPWTDSTAPVSIEADTATMTEALGEGSRFYRLIKR